MRCDDSARQPTKQPERGTSGPEKLVHTSNRQPTFDRLIRFSQSGPPQGRCRSRCLGSRLRTITQPGYQIVRRQGTAPNRSVNRGVNAAPTCSETP